METATAKEILTPSLLSDSITALACRDNLFVPNFSNKRKQSNSPFAAAQSKIYDGKMREIKVIFHFKIDLPLKFQNLEGLPISISDEIKAILQLNSNSISLQQ